MAVLKLVIVDDEPIILEGLLKTYDWEKLGFEIAGSAKSGRQALEVIRKVQPDVVLTDIRMKQISGLDVMETIRKEGGKTLFVVLSAYREFDYAQKALELGAVSYLLKPIEEEKLYAVFRDVHARCRRDQAEKRKQEKYHLLIDDKGEKIAAVSVQKFLDGKLDAGNLKETIALVGVEAEKSYFCALCADVHIALRITEGEKSQKVRTHLHSLLTEKIKDVSPGWEFENRDGHFIVIFRGETPKVSRMAEGLMEDISDTIGEKIVWGISKPLKGLQGIREGYAEAACRYREAGRIASPDLLTGQRENSGYSLAREAQVISAVRKNAVLDVKKAFIAFIYALPSDEDTEKQYLHRLLLRVQLMLQESYGLTERIDEKFRNYYKSLGVLSAAGSVDICYRLLMDAVREREKQKASCRNLKIGMPMEEAVAYIEAHLHEEDLSIVEVAEHVFLNPVYFGRVFKNTFGLSFKKYLVKRRMERAMCLLDENDLSIAAVCEEVGIGDPSYFSRLFKKHTGTLPSAYRKGK